jgi:hypothetical protein
MLNSNSREVYVEVAEEAVDKIQIALDKTLGVKSAGNSHIKPFKGIRDAYVKITGDQYIRQLHAPEVRAEEALTSTDFPGLLGRSMTRRLVQEYRLTDFHENIFISNIGSAADFADQEAVHAGYWKDVPEVDPETEDWVEPEKPGEEVSKYRVKWRGELIKVTGIVLRNDDLGWLERNIRGRARAYRRTFARFIWAFWNNNATFQPDGVAWFAAGHQNLFTDPISPSAIVTMINRIWEMVEPGSEEEIAYGDDRGEKLKLIVGRNLFWTAKMINERRYIDQALDPNPVYRQFGEKNERIIVSPAPGDADNWGVICDPGDREVIEVKFLDGRQEPEFIIADSHVYAEEGLTRDTIVYKDRHAYGATLGDWRNAAKSIVA